jgi:hypothetical protein
MIIYSSTSALIGVTSLGLSTLTFHGPNNQYQVHALTVDSQDVAQFVVPGNRSSYTVACLYGPDVQPEMICEVSRSSSGSGTTKMLVHGQEVKLVSSYELELRLPNAKLKFVTCDHGKIELREVLQVRLPSSHWVLVSMRHTHVPYASGKGELFCPLSCESDKRCTYQSSSCLYIFSRPYLEAIPYLPSKRLGRFVDANAGARNTVDQFEA